MNVDSFQFWFSSVKRFETSAYSVSMNVQFLALACFSNKTKSTAELHTSSLSV